MCVSINEYQARIESFKNFRITYTRDENVDQWPTDQSFFTFGELSFVR